MMLSLPEKDRVLAIICLNEVEQEDNPDFKTQICTIEYAVTLACVALLYGAVQKYGDFLENHFEKLFLKHPPTPENKNAYLSHLTALRGFNALPKVEIDKHDVDVVVNSYSNTLRTILAMDCTLRTGARITDTHLKNVYHELAKELAVFMPSTLLTNILSQDI